MSHEIMDFLPAVQAQNHVSHLLVAEIDDFIIDQQSVCGEGKIKFLVVFLFQLATVRHQLFTDIPVQQRFSAKKIHFQILPASGLLYQIIQRLLSHFQWHDSRFSAVIALSGKAVAAIHVAAVGHVQANGLQHRLLSLNL